jgi:hypothetical protein
VDGETRGCFELGFDRGLATCSACEWDTSNCNVCDLFWAETGDDNNAGTRAAPFRSLQKLQEFTSDGSGGPLVTCLEHGSTFAADISLAIVRSNFTLTAYGDPSSPRPTIAGLSVTPAPSTDPSYSHEFVFKTGLTAVHVWNGDVWASSAPGSGDFSADYDPASGLVKFDMTNPNAPVYASTGAALVVSVGNVGAIVNTVQVSNLHYQQIGGAITLTGVGGEGREFLFSNLSFENVTGVATFGSSFGGWVLDDVTFDRLDVKTYIYGIRTGFTSGTDYTISNSTFENPLSYLNSSSIQQSAAIKLLGAGYLNVEHNVFDMGDTNINAIDFIGTLIPGPYATTIPYKGGRIIGNVVKGGNVGIFIGGGNESGVQIINNIVDGSKIGIFMGWGLPGVQTAHNTIVDTTEIGARLDYLSFSGSSGQAAFVNNIVAVRQGVAIAVSPSSPDPALLRMNDNLYKGDIEVQNQTLTIAAWRGSGFDTNSALINTSPVQSNRTTIMEYTPTVSATFYKSGTVEPDVDVDIFNQQRSTTAPTRGAIEVIPR